MGFKCSYIFGSAEYNPVRRVRVLSARSSSPVRRVRPDMLSTYPAGQLCLVVPFGGLGDSEA